MINHSATWSLMNHIYIYIYAVEHLQSIRRWWIRSSIGSLPEDGQGQYKHKEVQQRDWVRPQRRDQRPTKNPKVVSSYRYRSTQLLFALPDYYRRSSTQQKLSTDMNRLQVQDSDMDQQNLWNKVRCVSVMKSIHVDYASQLLYLKSL